MYNPISWHIEPTSRCTLECPGCDRTWYNKTFKKQIIEGGPITVTDENIIRYFMTVTEAVELTIQAGAMGTGGDVFVLDMGKPVKIKKLAEKLILLSGLKIKDKNN